MKVAPARNVAPEYAPGENVAVAGFGYGLEASEPNVLIAEAVNAAGSAVFC